jgi:hypothetical protein
VRVDGSAAEAAIVGGRGGHFTASL